MSAPTEVPHKGLITASLMLATIMQVLDTTIANVALPAMRADLGASSDTINWVLTSYIVAAAIATPLTGWFSERYGRKEVFIASIIGFVAASMLCGIAWSLETMVLFRLAQGVFGAAIVPLSQTFLLDINPREKHGQAMAIWGAGIMVGPIIGPTLGGYLTDTINWRWVFYINVPLGAVALLGCAAYLPHMARRIRRFDFIGFAALAIGVGALQLMLDRGGEVDWFNAAEIWIELGIALSGFWVFVIWILGTEHPFLEPGMFKDRNFVTGLVFIFVIGIILLSSLALLPPMLSGIFQYPIITTGVVMAPRGMGTMITMIAAGKLLRVVDARKLVVTGLLLTAWSLYIMTGFGPQMDSTLIVVSGFVQGLGLGLVFVPLSTVAFATLDPQYRGDATALFSLVRNIGSSIGISIVTLLLTRNTQINHTELVANISLLDPEFAARMSGQLGGLMQSLTLTRGEGAFWSVINQSVNAQAAMISYVDDFKAMMWVTLCAIPLALFLRKPTARPAD
ncbi:DHA2 family multidrug resistance protein [Rhodobacter aestuarii]|uniref:MFS transporter, DHA2 family, multidrug resistance protein n=1 Tax=Rhodobacter aestuarii TaxID=453582 RepID=A0A1N7LSD6_9RHOB|nr:DHA2 family efflux MFS transporter permease subunit [Rhodobacter aestuarii]PTV95065.1 DHA2 family multidrug resistance protein [Rhodobacter aestuarii]SIS76672.1 MFS transporter, DHA2 family, multidrug resistance protein [Rhodobacter aestuarii]